MAAIFPGAVATQLQLLTAKNNTLLVLDAACDLDDTTITVDDSSALPDSGYLTFVDTDEVIYYAAKTATTLTGVVRAADGTTAATHLAGVDLEQRWNADYHNIVTLEMIAIEQNLSNRIGLHATQLQAPNGSLANPTYGFAANVDTGLTLLDGGTSLTLVVNGNREFAFTGAQSFVRLPILCQSFGTAADPAYAFDGISFGNCGMYLIADGNLGLSADATKVIDILPTGVGIGGVPNSKAILALSSTTLGFLPPVMTSTQRDAISSPANGLIIYNSTTSALNIYRSSAWKALLVPGLADIVNADVSASAAIAYSKLALSGSIVNADINASAAIAVSKLAAVTINKALASDSSGFITATTTTTTELQGLHGLTISRAIVTDGSGILSAATTTATEIGYVAGVTSAIQTQITAKKTIATGNNYYFCTTGATGLLQETAVTASRAVATDANGLPTASATTATELGYVSGVTSAIQTQLNSKLGGTNQPVNILYNGGMEIYQNRNGVATNYVSGDYFIDGWKFLKASNRQMDGGVETGAGNFSEGATSLKLTSGSGNSTADYVYQPVEEWTRYKTLVVSISVSVKTSTASSAKAFIDDGFSSVALSSYHTGGGTFEVLTATLTVSSSATKLSFGVQVTAAATIYMDAAFACIGSTAVTYKPEDPAVDLLRCQRYYEKSYLPTVNPGTSTTTNPIQQSAVGGTGQCYSALICFKATKRTNPTMTIYDTSGNSGKADWSVVGAAGTSRTSSWSTSAGLIPTWGATVTQAVNATDNFVSGHFVADARL